MPCTFQHMRFSNIIRLIFFSVIFISFSASSLELGRGKFPKEIFTREDFKGSNQSWAIDFDQHGRVYVANTDELLIYDGVRWEKLFQPKTGILRSVVVSQNKRVYIGGQNALGYYYSDDWGNWEYKSLDKNLPITTTELGAIRRGFEHSGKIYFKATDHIIEIDSDDNISAKKGNIGWLSGDVNKFWRETAEEGLLIVDQEGYTKQILDKASDVRGVYVSDDGYLVINRQGMLISITERGQTIIDNPLVKDSVIVEVSAIPGGIALSTWNQGLIVITPQGKTLHHIEHQSTSALTTRYSNGSLWVGFYGAILRIPWPVFAQQFDYETGLKGSVKTLTEFQDETYVGTLVGLHKFNKDTGLFDLQKLGGTSAYVWAIETTADGMLVATQKGLYFVNKKGKNLIFEGDTKSILRIRSHPSHYLVTSLTRGAALIKIEQGQAKIVKPYPNFKINKQTAVYADDGSIWIGTRNHGIYRISLNEALELDKSHLSAEVIANGRKKGNTIAYLFKLKQEIYVSSFGRVCRPLFEPQPICEDAQLFDENIINIKNVKNRLDDSLVVNTSSGTFLAIKQSTGARYRKVNSQLDNLLKRTTQFMSTYQDKTWMGRTDGLWKMDLPLSVEQKNVEIWVTQLIVNGQVTYNAAKFLSDLPFSLSASANKIRFSFGTNYFASSQSSLWRSKLVGYQNEFDSWSGEAWRDFTELPAGEYTIIIERKDITGSLSQSTPLHFEILAPWYLAVWAKVLYGLLTIVLLISVTRVYSRRKHKQLIKRHSELERQVIERTEELTAKQKQLLAQTKQLTELDHAKSRFFANITHEFRTPLTLMIGPLSDLIAGRFGKLASEQKQPVELALERSKDLMGLIEELLDISRLDAGVLVLQSEEVNIVQLINNVLSQLDSWSESKNITLTKSIECEEFRLVADARQMERVFYNLIGNAIKFTPLKGHINISIAKQNDGVLIEVEDNGMGIAEDEVEHIFERFHQVTKSQISNPGGVGLGLSLAKEITDLHYGELTVTSELGEGTCFSLYLPRDTGLTIVDNDGKNVDAISRIKPSLIEQYPNKKIEKVIDPKTTILVVEDDDGLRHYIAGHLRDYYQVIESVNGHDGWQQALKELPDLIVSDVMMPVMDGVSMCEKLKSNPETDYIPVILLTAKAEDSDRIEGFEQGADEYLAKPFSTDVLKARVANLILSRRNLVARAEDSQVTFPKPAGLVNRDLRFAERFQQAIQDGLSDSQLSVENIATKLNMDRSTLYTKTLSVFNSTPSDLIRHARLSWAKELVLQKNGTIADIAFTVGYASVAHFSQSFKKEFDCTPSQMRNQL